MKLKCLLLISIVAILGTTACSTKPVPSQSPLKPVSPVPTSISSSVVTPLPGRGVVMGELIDNRSMQPSPAVIVYLEPSVDHKVPPVLYGPLNNQPTTTSLKDGQFAITNVPPGEYVLIIYSPVDIWYYQEPDGQAILIQVKAGEVVDLGQVVTYIP